MIRIYDLNNYLRMEFETDPTGMVPRNFMQDIFACPDPVICVWDGFNGSAARRKLFANYKIGRLAADRSIFDGFKLVREVLTHTKAIQVTVPEYEADDVIATLTRRFAGQGHHVAIYSRDFDFGQLVAEAPDRVVCGANMKVEPRWVRLYKTTVGDPSDRIYGIPRFGQGGWDKSDLGRLQRAVEKWVTTHQVDESDFNGLAFTPGIKAWVAANTHQIETFWTIVGFFDVPAELIEQSTTVGKPDRARADAALKEWFQ